MKADHSKKRKKKSQNSSGSEDEAEGARKKKKDDKMSQVDDIVDDLRAKHGHAFNSLQYRVWAETIAGGRHVSLEKPPRGGYFQRPKSPSQPSSQPPHGSPMSSGKKATVITPVKAAELKSIYISQIKDLYALLEAGAITDNDFQKQKSTILDLMDKCK